MKKNAKTIDFLFIIDIIMIVKKANAEDSKGTNVLENLAEEY